MNRACLFLALWLATLVLHSQAVGQTQCQSHADYCRFGIGVDSVCPFVDGYTEVDLEGSAGGGATAQAEPEPDLRGRAVVAVLEVDADFGYDYGYDYYGLRYRKPYGEPLAATDTELSAADSEAVTTVEVVPVIVPPLDAGVAVQTSDEASPEAALLPERDYEQECYQAYLEHAAREAVPHQERDYEQECYQTYLEHRAREAEVAVSLAGPPAAESIGQYAGEAYDAYGYGYSYAYEYDYAHRYHNYPRMVEPAITEPPSQESADTVNIVEWVARVRARVAALWESELIGDLQASVMAWKARATAVLTRLDLERVYQQASHALVSAARQALVAESGWQTANVFVFVFESDLYAEPLAISVAPASDAVQQPATATVSQEATAADTVTSSDDAPPAVGSLTREQLEQWVRQAMAAGTEVWQRTSVALRQLAQRSLTLVANDDLGSPTHR